MAKLNAFVITKGKRKQFLVHNAAMSDWNPTFAPFTRDLSGAIIFDSREGAQAVIKHFANSSDTRQNDVAIVARARRLRIK